MAELVGLVAAIVTVLAAILAWAFLMAPDVVTSTASPLDEELEQAPEIVRADFSHVSAAEALHTGALVSMVFGHLDCRSRWVSAAVCKTWCDAAEGALAALDRLGDPDQLLRLLSARRVHGIELLGLARAEVTVAALQMLLSSIPSLQVLRLARCAAMSDDVCLRDSLPELTELDISLTKASEACLDALLRNSGRSLRRLCLAQSRVTTLEGIAACTALESLDISYLALPHVASLGEVLTASRRTLAAVDLSGLPIDADDVELVGRTLSRLARLRIFGCKRVTAASIRTLLRTAARLTALDVGLCPRLVSELAEDEAFAPPQACRLVELGFFQALAPSRAPPTLAMPVLAHLASSAHAATLTSLDLRATSLTDDDLCELGALRALRRLDLGGSLHLGSASASLERLESALPRCEVVRRRQR